MPYALTMVEKAMEMIREVELLLPASAVSNFRQRLVTELEESDELNPELRRKAEALLKFYEEVFGVDDLVERPD